MDIKTAKRLQAGKALIWIRSKGKSGAIATVDEDNEEATVVYGDFGQYTEDFPIDVLETKLTAKPDSDLYPPYHHDYYRDMEKWRRQNPSDG